MAETTEVKNKVVTLETLKVLHEYNKEYYMHKTNPSGEGEMSMDGNATFSGDVNVASFSIGSNIKFVPTDDYLEIVFLT